MSDYISIINPFSQSKETLEVNSEDRDLTINEFVDRYASELPVDTDWHLVDKNEQPVGDTLVGDFLARGETKVWLALGGDAIKGGF